MDEALIEHLACPQCLGEIRLGAAQASAGQIQRGTLRCASCGLGWPIEEGVPNFVAEGDRADVIRTTSGFARNWDAYNDVILDNEKLNDELFRDWIAPFDPEGFRGRLVLEPGCGMGRWLRVAKRYGPRTLIGVDYSEVAYTAARNLRGLRDVHVIRADILRLPLKRRIEDAYCLGVVHHTPEPARTFGAIVDALEPGGRINCWVYGAENNGWITRWVNPIRIHVTSRLPHRMLAVLSRALAALLFGAAWAASRMPSLPYGEYLRYLRRYPFDYMSHIVYDHLVPEIAHYIRRDELESWARERGMAYQISARNGNSWRLLGTRPAAAQEAEEPPAATGS
jgi:SAM-dependent methyltransferase